ncbi:hypothetical protein PG997_012024 [Apiospora hydei]|uniref:Uncharacterized protein n=1 Tax=Apiospora hydei TaxID=1337664 RepID=A0ABR1V284_9PEZI
MRPPRHPVDPGPQHLVDVPERRLAVKQHLVEQVAQLVHVGAPTDPGLEVVGQGPRLGVAAVEGELRERVRRVHGRPVGVVAAQVGHHGGALVVAHAAHLHVAAAGRVGGAPGEVPFRAVDDGAVDAGAFAVEVVAVAQDLVVLVVYHVLVDGRNGGVALGILVGEGVFLAVVFDGGTEMAGVLRRGPQISHRKPLSLAGHMYFELG